MAIDNHHHTGTRGGWPKAAYTVPPMSLTLYVVAPMCGGDYVIEAEGKTLLGDVKKQISSAIAVPVEDFEMVHGGEVMGDMNMLVSGTALCEGDEVVIEPSRRFLAGQRLREMGVEATMECLKQQVLGGGWDEAGAVVELMVEHDEGFANSRNGRLNTPLHVACTYSSEPCVRALVEKGRASIDATDISGVTPLVIAVVTGSAQIVRYLLSMGASVNHQDNVGYAALHHAAACSRSPACVQALLQYGANPNVTDCNGKTPLHIAAHTGNWQIAEFFLRGGIDASIRDKQGMTARHIAEDQTGGSCALFLKVLDLYQLKAEMRLLQNTQSKHSL